MDQHRPLAFEKMEALVREMQDPETGVPVGSQKIFLTHVPSAFMGYDLIEWLMEHYGIEESEALNLGNQLCQYGYFFPVNDSKTLVIKDDSTLYRFQSPYYWPWQQRGGAAGGGGVAGAGGGGGTTSGATSPPPTHPDNVEYAVYLCKRTKRNRQRHVLEEYEAEALAGLRRNLQAKWEFITMQANEQVKIAKERKKGDKIVSDSQERAYWRVYRPPPGVPSPLESCPIPSRCRNGPRSRRRDLDHCKKEVEFLRSCLSRTRVKVSVALEALLQYAETFAEYDPLITPVQPSNPWVTDDITYWQINSPIVEIPTEKRVRRWAVSIEELVSDPTGLQEFTAYLRKEYSHENIRFWIAVNDLRHSSQSQIHRKVKEIFNEFLDAGAPCEINIDGKTQERVQQEIKNPSRFTYDAAADHVYALLLKKDCYPRFIRSDHYKSLIAAGKQPLHKKRFFGFGGPAKKKSSTTAPPVANLLQQSSSSAAPLGRRRGSDRSLSGSAHELAVSGVRDAHQKVPHSHSQSNLSDIPYRGDLPCQSKLNLVAADHCLVEVSSGETGAASGGEEASLVCPWDSGPERLDPPRSRNNSALDSCSSSSDISVAVTDVSERLRRTCALQQPDMDRRAAPVRRLSAFEPRRGPLTAPGLKDDFPHRSFDSSTAPSPFTRDKDDNSGESADEAFKNRKTGLLKSYSVSSAVTTVAPVISVSSVSDEPSDSEHAPLPEDTPGISEAVECTPSSHSLSPSPLSPTSFPLPDVEEKSETGREDIEEVTLVQSIQVPCHNIVEDVDRVAVAPLAEVEDAVEDDEEEEEALEEKDEQLLVKSKSLSVEEKTPPSTSQQTVPTTTSQQSIVSMTIASTIETTVIVTTATPTTTASLTTTTSTVTTTNPTTSEESQTQPQGSEMTGKREKDSDICPWEDEETCKMDTPFVKTYATLGYL